MTTREKILTGLIGILSLGIIFSIGTINECQKKVEFYEKVMYDFGIEEYINYPELYYDETYNDQVKVHNCLWVFDYLEQTGC